CPIPSKAQPWTRRPKRYDASSTAERSPGPQLAQASIAPEDRPPVKTALSILRRPGALTHSCAALHSNPQDPAAPKATPQTEARWLWPFRHDSEMLCAGLRGGEQFHSDSDAALPHSDPP